MAKAGSQIWNTILFLERRSYETNRNATSSKEFRECRTFTSNLRPLLYTRNVVNNFRYWTNVKGAEIVEIVIRNKYSNMQNCYIFIENERKIVLLFLTFVTTDELAASEIYICQVLTI